MLGGEVAADRSAFGRVVDAVGVVFEQMGDLSVDLERVGVVQPVEIEQLAHIVSVLQTDTNVERLQPGRVAPAMNVDTM